MRGGLKSWLAVLVVLLAGISGVAQAEPSRGGKGKPPLTGVVNLNQANEDALELLPGIGPAKAQRILDHRKAHPFKKVDDLTKVKGIGRKTMAKLRRFLSVSGPTTLTDEKPAEDGAEKPRAAIEKPHAGAKK